MLVDSQARIRELPLLSERERSQLLVEFNASTAEYPADASIQALFETQAERTPNAVAVVCGNEKISYADLNRRANQLARVLQRLDVGPEALVGLYLDRSI